VSGATTKQVIFKKPDASITTQNLVFSTKTGDAGDGTDGRVEFVIPDANFLDQAGTWEWQLRLIIPAWDGHSDKGSFTVASNLA
jgi:hypothetical protein